MLASICQPPTYPARNAFALFRRRFDLTDVPDTAPFHLFADTRYRLSVNGTIIGSGPTRFYPGFPPYDSHDIAPYLRAGENEIRVEVNHRGASSFQAVPSQLGFVAWDDWGAGLGTPGAWQSKVSRAWNADAPAFSFAQGPIEILNAAALEAEWQNKSGWQTPILAPDAWGELEPRSVPNVPNRVLPAPAMAQCAALSDAETFVGFARVCDDDARAKSPRDRFAVALVLDSPRAQTVELGLFWGDNTLNGVALQAHKDEQLGNRQNASAHLRAGENLLWAEVEALMPSWGFCLAWPTASGVTLNGPMRTSALMAPDALGQRRGDVPISPDDVASFDWLRPLDEFATSAFPARQVAWETPARALAELGWQNAPLLQSGAAVALWDFQKTVLGHVRFEIECEAETTVDVTLDERLRADGLLDVYGSNPFVNGTDRYVLAAGTHQIEGYHPRGGRYLQLNVRSEGAVQLRDLSLRSAVTHLGEQGDFRCSDPLLNQIWELGRATVEACWPDVWVDCPWREQGAYVGDTLVEFGAAQMLSSDRQTMRRALQLWAQGQREDGQMPSCVPAWMLSSHADFTLIYILALRDYFAATGDADLVRELWPHVEKIWDSPRWKSGDGVLWDADAEMHLFIDWSVPQEQKLGRANGALNALRVGALEATAQLASAIGQGAERWHAERERVVEAMRARLWRAESNDFAAFAGDDSPAYHANIWALRFGLLEDESGLMARLREALSMFEAPEDLEARDGHPELYFCHYVLEALCARGLHAEALTLVRRAWSPMMERGAVTFWERLCSGKNDAGSLCHAWSCAPIWFLGREVLGLHPVYGQPNQFTFAAPDCDLEWARGEFPHVNGPIRVAWRRVDGEVEANIEAPEGVEVLGKSKVFPSP